MDTPLFRVVMMIPHRLQSAVFLVCARVTLGNLIAATLMILLPLAASAQTCTSRFSSEQVSTTPSGGTVVALSPFRLSCRGDITGTLDVLAGSRARAWLQIEHLDRGTWTVVGTGRTIAYRAEPGTYRLMVDHAGSQGGFITWRLRYSQPLP